MRQLASARTDRDEWNGDALYDLLYTVNFAWLGLHEEWPPWPPLAGGLADPRGCGSHPDLDGAWPRGFEARSHSRGGRSLLAEQQTLLGGRRHRGRPAALRAHLDLSGL